MNGSANPLDESSLRILIEVQGNPPLVWRVPSSGLVLGSALGCDIRLPVDHPPVLLTVFPVRESAEISACIRPLAPLVEMRHGEKEWPGGLLPAGEKIQIGSLRISLLNASAQRLDHQLFQPENIQAPAGLSAPATIISDNPKPKKKLGWLRRWQRSLELRESTLLASQAWGPPPVTPIVQHPTGLTPSQTPHATDRQAQDAADPRWRELEEWIQSAREQAEACARERAKLLSSQTELAIQEHALREGRAELEAAWVDFHQASQAARVEQGKALQKLEQARQSIAAQAAALAEFRRQLETERADPMALLANSVVPHPTAPSNHELPALFEALATTVAPEPRPVQWIAPVEPSGTLPPMMDTVEVSAQIATLLNELSANQPTAAEIPSSPEPQSIQESSPEPIELPQEIDTEAEMVETPVWVPGAQWPDIPNAVARQEPEPPLEEWAEKTIVGPNSSDSDGWEGEDPENFLPKPDEADLEAFYLWCTGRLQKAAAAALAELGETAENEPAPDGGNHRHGFARRLLEQGIGTPKLLAPLTRLATARAISLEDLLTRLEVFTTHQIATMGLGCAADLVIGRWFILDLPAIDAIDVDRELVFRVFDPKTNMARTLRILAPAEARKPGHADEYLQRHQACAHIDSEHLLSTVEVFKLNDLPCALQEETVGASFEAWPSMSGSATVWYRLFLQAAVALRDLHQAGLHHGHLGTCHLLLKTEGLLKLREHATPLWLVPNANQENQGPAGDIAALARIGQIWWSGPQGENQRHLPEPLAGVLARLEPDHPAAITSAKALAEELDRAGILLPSGAAAWQRFLEEFRGPDATMDHLDDSMEPPDEPANPLRRTA